MRKKEKNAKSIWPPLSGSWRWAPTRPGSRPESQNCTTVG
jgi:hypothetical protein